MTDEFVAGELMRYWNSFCLGAANQVYAQKMKQIWKAESISGRSRRRAYALAIKQIDKLQ